MKNIWAPWRIDYILSPKSDTCVLCKAPGDGDGLIITRGEQCFAIMNRFPYTTGHSMVAPYRHVSDIEALTKEELSEMMSLVQAIVSATRKAMNTEGFNIGCNLGDVAGAGIADHLHMHIVPRWKGDTNFMPVLGDVHVISDHIVKTMNMIKGKLP
ncbi:MAG TPA: HIT domain-containing protein [Deltaproteobacteria bacterium]|nr:HIT domain-containing protein [Deltaproteobacteria bacterium]HPR55269.1 HIT domain-containing protein [Deltaproteobacteria bacterium]HXK46906.1 HIT domain-containing protein [Deltaproteobacteria bacterium]